MNSRRVERYAPLSITRQEHAAFIASTPETPTSGYVDSDYQHPGVARRARRLIIILAGLLVVVVVAGDTAALIAAAALAGAAVAWRVSRARVDVAVGARIRVEPRAIPRPWGGAALESRPTLPASRSGDRDPTRIERAS